MDEIKLTLDGAEDSAIQPQKENNSLKDINLTEEEEKMVEEFAKTIDLTNSNIVLQYGIGAQRKIADFSEKTLNSVKTKDFGEVGDMLTNIVTQLKTMDDKEDNKGIIGFFKKQQNKLDTLKVKYNKVEENVDNVAKMLETHQIQMMKDISILDQMYDLNAGYFKELSMYIIAGKKKLDEVNNVVIPKMQQESLNDTTGLKAQEISDMKAMAVRFEKKIHDLELTRAVSLQMAPQIRMVQSANTVMAEKIQSTIVNTIPIWKNQMVLSLGMHHTKQAINAQQKVTDYTNELLKKNADMLHQSVIDTATATERGIVDIETIKYTNEKLISAIEEVAKIQQEGHAKRIQAQTELETMENDLKQRMLNA